MIGIFFGTITFAIVMQGIYYTNFDRNWEGTMSDISYDKSRCRNIVLDIRFTLWLIDVYAGAGYLIKDMSIIWPKTK